MKRAAALGLLLAAGLAWAEEKRDRYGDPLPPGATLRLGTLRLRHAGTATAVAFSPDGKTVASAGEDRTIRLWELASGKQTDEIKIGQTASTLAFSSDGSQLLSYAEGAFRVNDLATKKETKRFGAVNGRGSFSGAGDLAASSDQNGTVSLNEVSSGRVLFEQRGEAGVDAVALSPDGKKLAFGNRENTIRFWDLETATETRLLGHEGWVSALVFSPDGKTLYSASADRTVRVWQDGKLVKKLEGHKDYVDLLAVSPDGKTLASWSRDETLELWDAATMKERLSRHAAANGLAFSPDSRLLALAGFHAVSFLSVDSGREHAVATGHEAFVACVAFSGDSRTVASGSADETVRLWEVGSGREVRRLDAHKGGVSALAYGPRLLASGGRDGTVRLWDPATGNVLASLEAHGDAVVSVVFSPDGKTLASCGDQTVKLWDLSEGKDLKMLRQIGVGGDPGPLVWSPDGKTLACGSGDHVIRTFDAATGKEGPKLDGQKRLLGLAFSPDGKALAAAGEEPSLKLWEVAAGHELRPFPVEDPSLGCVAFSGDGKRIAVGRVDGPVRVFDFASGKELRSLDPGRSGAFCLAYAPDGRVVAWGAADGTVLVGEAR